MSDAAPAKPTMTATAVLAPADFQLAPPEIITPVVPEASKSAVPLAEATKTAVDAQVAKYVEALLTEDVESATFKGKLDSAFALGREEISIASSLLQGRFMQQNFVGAESTPAYKAIGEIRAQLDELNPGKQGDLFQPNKLLGFIPWGNKLQAYFRKYQSAGTQLQTSMQQLYLARDDMQRDVVEIESTRGKLWDGMQKLAGAIHFSEKLDGQLAERVTALKATDPKRAHALEQEVLFYVRQNLQDMLTQQSVCINGYLALDVLKKTGREMVNGCSRVATTGMSALAVAQTVARATGNQLQVMEMLQGVNSTIEGLIAETGKQLNTHVEKTTEFSQNPGLGMEKLKEMFDQTFKAMDAMDTFRSKAIDVMGKNNVMLKDQIARSETYLDRVRQQQAREATGAAVTGPVKL
jgi:uncharacterized protein YaaN involved in tellurite resistance